MAKDAALEDKWKQRVEEYRQSGLSIRDWCHKNELKETTFKYYFAAVLLFKQISTKQKTIFPMTTELFILPESKFPAFSASLPSEPKLKLYACLKAVSKVYSIHQVSRNCQFYVM